MTTISARFQPPLPAPRPMRPKIAAKSAALSELSDAPDQPPQEDSYERTRDKGVLPMPKGAYKNGEAWVMPPDTLKRIDQSGGGDRLLAKEEANISAQGMLSGNGGAGASDAEFKGAIMLEAVEYSDLEKRIHNLLGYTLETFKTTFTAEVGLSAKTALANGTFFRSDFSAYAASYSLWSIYTFDENFRAQYGVDKTAAVEYGFNSLRTMMESYCHQAVQGRRPDDLRLGGAPDQSTRSTL